MTETNAAAAPAPEAAPAPAPTPAPAQPATEQEITEADIQEELKHQRDIRNKVQNVLKNEKVSTLEQAGISQPQIDQWKQQHGPIECITVAGQIYVYRGIRRQELKKLQDDTVNADDALREDMIAEKCTLYPQLNRLDFPHGSAGLPTILAERIMGLSGFQFEEEAPVRL